MLELFLFLFAKNLLLVNEDLYLEIIKRWKGYDYLLMLEADTNDGVENFDNKINIFKQRLLYQLFGPLLTLNFYTNMENDPLNESSLDLHLSEKYSNLPPFPQENNLSDNDLKNFYIFYITRAMDIERGVYNDLVEVTIDRHLNEPEELFKTFLNLTPNLPSSTTLEYIDNLRTDKNPYDIDEVNKLINEKIILYPENNLPPAYTFKNDNKWYKKIFDEFFGIFKLDIHKFDPTIKANNYPVKKYINYDTLDIIRKHYVQETIFNARNSSIKIIFEIRKAVDEAIEFYDEIIEEDEEYNDRYYNLIELSNTITLFEECTYEQKLILLKIYFKHYEYPISENNQTSEKASHLFSEEMGYNNYEEFIQAKDPNGFYSCFHFVNEYNSFCFKKKLPENSTNDIKEPLIKFSPDDVD
jgi:hypothetical protein